MVVTIGVFKFKLIVHIE